MLANIRKEEIQINQSITFNNITVIDFEKEIALLNKDLNYPIFIFEGSLYFPKRFNMNELIGEELGNQLNLKTVKNRIFMNKKTGEYFIASKDFNNPQFDYFHPTPKVFTLYKI